MIDRLRSFPHRLVPTCLLSGMLLLGVVLSTAGCDDETTAPTKATEPSAAVIVTAPSFRAVSSGTFNGCGVTTGQRAYCWGWNLLSTLGNGSTDDSWVPVAVLGP
jgi:alpha-tubulin suppressor-like RCC1 family protein